jgi:hypothetical protein
LLSPAKRAQKGNFGAPATLSLSARGDSAKPNIKKALLNNQQGFFNAN